MANVEQSANMPKIEDSSKVCFLCGKTAFFVSFNSKRARCEERITRCPGYIEKALTTRKAKYPRKVYVPKPRGQVTDDTKKKMRIAAAKRDNSNIGRYVRTEQHRQNLREQMYLKIEKGIVVPLHDTKPELEFAKYLEEAGIGYKKQFVIQFGKIGIDRFRHAYDFHILGTNIIVEIDGDYWHSSEVAIERDKICDKVADDYGFHVIRVKTSELKSAIDRLTCL